MRLLTVILAFCAIVYCSYSIMMAAIIMYGWKAALAMAVIILLSFLAIDLTKHTPEGGQL